VNWTVALEPEDSHELFEAILAPLRRHSSETIGSGGDYQPLIVSIRDEAGAVVGGLHGYTLFRFAFVELLATGPARGQGLLHGLFDLAETEARRRGCVGVWLDTFTFQAPLLYPKLGFTECGRITDFPPGHDRIFFVKRFEDP
jgi:GNAT superfamily N-acetyltransferase